MKGSSHDSILNFLASPVFQVPVMSFIDEKCIVFDAVTDDLPEYRKIHEEYKTVVSVLLEAFRDDMNMTYPQFMKSLAEMNKISEIQTAFRAVFEQVLAVENYRLFVKIMAQHNVELQQQALLLLMQMMGTVPDSLQPVAAGASPSGPSSSQPSTSKAPAAGPAAPGIVVTAPDEEAILIAVLKDVKESLNSSKSEQEFIEDQKKQMNQLKSDEVEQAAQFLTREKTKAQIEVAKEIKQLNLDDPSAAACSSGWPTPAEAKQDDEAPMDVSKLPPLTSKPAAASSSATTNSGAQSWIQSALASSTTEPSAGLKATVDAMASSVGSDAVDLKSRQEFLIAQRNKLLELKRREREKQLENTEQNEAHLKGRPKSARAAKNALSRRAIGKSGDVASVDESPEDSTDVPKVDETTIKMRRALAEKLRSEVVDMY